MSDKEYVREKWNEVYKQESAPLLPHKDLTEIVGVFRKRGVKRILDLGYGSGRHAVYLAARGFEVWGIDISDEGRRLVESRAKDLTLKVCLTLGSIYEPLPYEENFFDALICTRTLHHGDIGQIRISIKEMERVLKPEGFAFVTVRKRISKTKRIPFRVTGPRTYVPIEGKEKGLTHYLFNQEQLRKEFKNFKIDRLWVDADNYYCLLGELRKP